VLLGVVAQGSDLVHWRRGGRRAATEHEEAAGAENEHAEAHERRDAKPRVHNASIGKPGAVL